MRDIPRKTGRPRGLGTREMHTCGVWPGNDDFSQYSKNIKRGFKTYNVQSTCFSLDACLIGWWVD